MTENTRFKEKFWNIKLRLVVEPGPPPTATWLQNIHTHFQGS
jgi:hypothetical protein